MVYGGIIYLTIVHDLPDDSVCTIVCPLMITYDDRWSDPLKYNLNSKKVKKKLILQKSKAISHVISRQIRANTQKPNDCCRTHFALPVPKPKALMPHRHLRGRRCQGWKVPGPKVSVVWWETVHFLWQLKAGDFRITVLSVLHFSYTSRFDMIQLERPW